MVKGSLSLPEGSLKATYLMLKLQFLIIVVVLLGGCNSSGVDTDVTVPANPEVPQSRENLVIPDNSARSDYKLLLFGNSHIVGLSEIINTLISHTLPLKPVAIRAASSQRYLDERLNDGTSLAILQNDNWSHIILQAQKYSQSGTVRYPTDATQQWAFLAKQQQTIPILFPEHPQRGNDEEGQRVYALHQSIAAKQAACVAPVGPVWDKVIALRPELVLHHEDGNHASDLGKLLSALVFYEIITAQPADLLPTIDELGIDAEVQAFFGQIVSQTIAANPPCQQP